MSGYYPDGVTGNEDEIAGPIDEHVEEQMMHCEDCDTTEEVEVTITVWRDSDVRRWRCKDFTCGAEYETEVWR